MQVTMWIRLNFENIILSERSQTQSLHVLQFHLSEISKGGKSGESKHIGRYKTLVVDRHGTPLKSIGTPLWMIKFLRTRQR